MKDCPYLSCHVSIADFIFTIQSVDHEAYRVIITDMFPKEPKTIMKVIYSESEAMNLLRVFAADDPAEFFGLFPEFAD